MSRMSQLSAEATYLQFHRPIGLQRNRRKTYVLLPNEQRPMTAYEQFKLGLIALPFIAALAASIFNLG